VWSPLLYYFARYEIRKGEFQLLSIYGVWVGLLMTTMAMSLMFDIRDVMLIAMGLK
jgi:hypothetical protein